MRLVAVDEVDGELELTIETTTSRVGCRGCGVIARLHDRRDTVVRDVAGLGRAVRLRWRKRVWRCVEPACGVRTWTEQHPAIAPRAALTQRVREDAAGRVARGESVAAVARDLGVGWATVMRAFAEHGQRWLDDAEQAAAPTRVLGLDETVWQRAGWHRRTRYATGFVDGDTGQLLDLVEGRSTAAAAGWLSARDNDWRAAVRVVAIDPFEGYARAIRGQLPHAQLVVDHFHAIRLGNRVVDDVRRRVQQQTLGHRGRKHDPLYRVRRLLLLAAGRLDPRGWARLEAAWDAGDPDHEVYTAWAVKELLRDVYAAATLDDAREALATFYDWAANSTVPECRRLARTVRRWERQILAWHTTGGASNGPTEAANLLIKKVNRVGHGFRNWNNYRLRVLVHCKINWHNQTTTRIRGRRIPLPRFVA